MNAKKKKTHISPLLCLNYKVIAFLCEKKNYQKKGQTRVKRQTCISLPSLDIKRDTSSS